MTHDNPETDLLRRAQAGDHDAFAQLIRLHQAGLRGIAGRLVASPDEVFDLVQETFIRAWNNLSTFDPALPFGPWVRTICRNLVANHLRDRAAERTRAQRAVDEQVLETPTLEQVLADSEDNAELVARLRRCCEKLAPRQREILRARYEDSLSVPEIGKRLRSTTAAIAMTLSRVRAALLRCVETPAPQEAK